MISRLACCRFTCFSISKKSKPVYHWLTLNQLVVLSASLSSTPTIKTTTLFNSRLPVLLNKRPISQQRSKMTHQNLLNLLKPFNVLVYIDTNEKCDDLSFNCITNGSSGEQLTQQFCDRLFESIQDCLTYFLSQKFTIYLTTLEELSRRAWFDSTRILIVISPKQVNESSYLNQPRNHVIKEFKTETNNVIIIDRPQLATSTDHQKFTLNVDLLKSKVQQLLGNEIIYDSSKTPEKTTHYVYTDDIELSTRLLNYLVKEQSLRAQLCKNPQDLDVKFDVKKYLARLNSSNRLGRNVIVSNVTESTQPIAEHSPSIESLIVIANQQTKGKGRGKNQWLSPEGSISFTYAVSVPLNSLLFKSLGFFQHINALAIQLAIKKFDNMDKLDLKIKWPNDIYYKSKHKIVGILTNSQFEGNCAKFFIGIGINLSNEKPSYSLKNIFEDELKDDKFSITKEEIIAEFLNQVDTLIKLINKQGKEKIVDMYYENWMLTDKIIQLDTGKQAQVLGLDEDGFLRVNLLDEGEIVSLMPGGNRWDILQNLVINPSK